MDKIDQNQILKCQLHPKCEITFVQVNELEENKRILYCNNCVSKDYSFKPKNYVHLQDILESSADSIVYNWPPLNSSSLQQQLIDLNDLYNPESSYFETKINKFFEDLRSNIAKQIDMFHKKMLMDSQESWEQYGLIRQQYFQISKLDQFKEILLQKQEKQSEMESLCRDFLQKFHNEQQNNTKLFQKLFFENKKLFSESNFDKLEVLQQQIFEYIEQICILANERPIEQEYNEIVDEQNYSFTIQNNMNEMVNLLPSIHFIQSKFVSMFENLFEDNIVSIETNINNNSISLKRTKDNASRSYYSDIILNKSKTYVIQLRVNIDSHSKFQINFGLLIDDTKDTTYIKDDHLHFCLVGNDSKLYLPSDSYGISHILKGYFNFYDEYQEFELLVNINKQMLQLTDIPLKNTKVVLDSNYLPNLLDYENYRLGFSIFNQCEFSIIKIIEF